MPSKCYEWCVGCAVSCDHTLGCILNFFCGVHNIEGGRGEGEREREREVHDIVLC